MRVELMAMLRRCLEDELAVNEFVREKYYARFPMPPPKPPHTMTAVCIPDTTTSIRVQWEEPWNFDSEIVEYYVEYCPMYSVRKGDSDDVAHWVQPHKSIQGSRFFHRFLNLQASEEGTAYKIRICAENAGGRGEWQYIMATTQPEPPHPDLLSPRSMRRRNMWRRKAKWRQFQLKRKQAAVCEVHGDSGDGLGAFVQVRFIFICT